ncbi:MAG TPA: DUF6468 domain-containing protein [Rickettsiales bacterium]|nr:DUF6468 domain-containing protein [Rickettsiales bacterium]
MIVSLLFDTLLAALLIATISYCSKLSRRIKTLQDGRSELAGMIAQFDAATNRAVSSVNDLQIVSKKLIDSMQVKIDKANFLADDLAFLIEKSNKIILQLEQQTKAASNEAKKLADKNTFSHHSNPQHLDKIVSQIAANAQPAKPAPVVMAARPQTIPQQPPANDGFNIKPHSGPAASDRLADILKAEARIVPRTGAERELLEALKSRP